MSNANTWDPQVSHEDLVRKLDQVQNSVDFLRESTENGIVSLKESTDRIMAKQDTTNGHVRELREWRAVQEALERERQAERQALQQERGETSNRIRILMDAEKARVAAAETTDKARNRMQSWLQTIAALGGAIGLLDLIKHFLK